MARKKGGFAAGKFKDTNGTREPGNFKKFDVAATASKLGTKTKSDGFKAGGAIGGASATASLAKRARGGRTSAPFSSACNPSARAGSSSSGHEGE